MRHTYPPVQTHMRLPVHSLHSRLFSLSYSLHLSLLISSEEASSTKHQGLESERKSLTELQKECTAKRWVIWQPAIIRPSLFSFSSLVLYPPVQWSHICQTLPWWAAEWGTPSFCKFFWERFGRLDGQLKQTEGMLDIFVFSHPLELHCVTISRLYCAMLIGLTWPKGSHTVGWPLK